MRSNGIGALVYELGSALGRAQVSDLALGAIQGPGDDLVAETK